MVFRGGMGGLTACAYPVCHYDLMKTLISLLILGAMLVHCQGDTNVVEKAIAPRDLFAFVVYANGIGDKWYSASELEQIAKDYAKQRKIDFDFTKAGRSVWIYTGGSNIIARVSFASDFGKPIYIADIDRSGKVATNYVGITVGLPRKNGHRN